MLEFLKVIVAVTFIATVTSSCAQTESSGNDLSSNSEKIAQHSEPARSSEPVELGNVVANSLVSIKKLLGTTCQSDNQCKVIGVGSRPCGGPELYLTYSTQDTDEEKLKSLVAIFNKDKKQKNTAKGAMGICQHLSPPKTYCSVNQCVTSQDGQKSEI
jgi:predicted small secreted protein